MAFRKRNVAINRTPDGNTAATVTSATPLPRGVRPSPLTSHPVTSTGASSLDGLLGGHGGLALGCSLFIEESGTTDFAGALLRYYAAEGICQGHLLHVIGSGEQWAKELPGIAEERTRRTVAMDQEKMKIAWRYEKLGQAGERVPSDRSIPAPSTQDNPIETEVPFCHTFDLTKRLQPPPDAKVDFVRVMPTASPFEAVLKTLQHALQTSPPGSIHRIVIPTILSPALYHPQASRPESFLQFMHGLRSLLRQYSRQLTALITLPLELFPRNSALIRTAEILSDGVLEFTPFPHLMDSSNALTESGGARSNDEQPQGLVHVHKLPLNTERGEGGAAGSSLGEDFAFSISRRKFTIKPFSLPPLEGDQEAQKEAGKITAKDVEF